MSNKFNLILFLSLVLCLDSCQFPNNISTISEEIRISKQDNKDRYVVVSATANKHSKIKNIRHCSYALCDPFMEANRFIYYCCDLKIGLEFAFLLNNGTIKQIYAGNSEQKDFSNYNFKIINWRINAYEAIKNNDKDTILTLSSLADSSFYSLYLLSKMYYSLGQEDNGEKYTIMAANSFERNPDKMLYPLYYEIMKDEKTTDAICFPEELRDSINLGEIKKGEIIKKVINYRNISNNDLLIFQAIPSCNCVKAQFSQRTSPYSLGQLIIEFDTHNENKGESKKSITVYSNSENKIEIIPIKVKII